MYSQFILTNNGHEIWALNGEFSEEFISGAYHAWFTAKGYVPAEELDDNYGIMVREENGNIIFNPLEDFADSHVVEINEPLLGEILKFTRLRDTCRIVIEQDGGDGYYMWMWGPY